MATTSWCSASRPRGGAHSIGQPPQISLNFNSGAHGDDAWILDATYSTEVGIRPRKVRTI